MTRAAAFWKMCGSGNDFVFLDGRQHAPEAWTAARLSALCDRRHGVGADGVVFLSPEVDGARMVYFNADGGRAEMCGNAALCSTRLAARWGIAPAEGMQLHTDAGVLRTRCIGDGAMAEIRLGELPVPQAVTEIPLEADEVAMAVGRVGVPHLVVLVRDVTQVDLSSRGRRLREDARFAPHGVNANFISAPASRGERWQIRTFERGVESETLACGTGTVAASLALAGWGHTSLPVEWISWGGAPLAVSGTLTREGSAQDVWLAGEGRLVFTGELAE